MIFDSRVQLIGSIPAICLIPAQELLIRLEKFAISDSLSQQLRLLIGRVPCSL